MPVLQHQLYAFQCAGSMFGPYRGAPTGLLRAITRAITPGQSGVITVTRGQSTESDAVHRKHKTAGQRVSDLRWEWWPGAGSNRRPSDFTSDSTRVERARVTREHV